MCFIVNLVMSGQWILTRKVVFSFSIVVFFLLDVSLLIPTFLASRIPYVLLIRKAYSKRADMTKDIQTNIQLSSCVS
jgi:hypothetical protein